MATHKSAKKRIRQIKVRRMRNRYVQKTARNAIRGLRSETNKKVAEEQLPKVISIVDKLAKNNLIHKNKAANLKSKLTRKVSTL
ncbi:MAG: 30S ribosomal protein S20 [Crocinitomicaceae bacterium]|nr:30S ribosomal protein S20 [Crocinitomicaceae bacterium]|tara:strand:+ start:6726 stop:6977 length:252 start_codon:yes stop_codon:yes gene_type:complete